MAFYPKSLTQSAFLVLIAPDVPLAIKPENLRTQAPQGQPIPMKHHLLTGLLVLASVMVGMVSVHLAGTQGASTPASAEDTDRKILTPLRVAVVDYRGLLDDAEIAKERDRFFQQVMEEQTKKRREEIENAVNTITADIQREEEKASPDESHIERLNEELQIWRKKGEAFKEHMKVTGAQLRTKFAAQALAAVLHEVRAYSVARFDLVLNRYNLKAASKGQDARSQLTSEQQFSEELLRSTVLYFNGQDPNNPSQNWRIEDITSSIRRRLTMPDRNWDFYREAVNQILGTSDIGEIGSGTGETSDGTPSEDGK